MADFAEEMADVPVQSSRVLNRLVAEPMYLCDSKPSAIEAAAHHPAAAAAEVNSQVGLCSTRFSFRGDRVPQFGQPGDGLRWQMLD